MKGQCDCVRDKVEIHNYERKIANTLKRIEDSSIGEEDKQLLLKFHKECTIKGLSKARILKYFDVLGRIAIWFNKPLQQVKKEDIMNLVQRVESSNYSEWTKHDYKVVLKIFYRWLRKTEDYPEEVKWIKTSFRSQSMPRRNSQGR
jgi:site-specific recombinase XerD